MISVLLKPNQLNVLNWNFHSIDYWPQSNYYWPQFVKIWTLLLTPLELLLTPIVQNVKSITDPSWIITDPKCQSLLTPYWPPLLTPLLTPMGVSKGSVKKKPCIRCPITSDEINTFCDLLDFVENLWNQTQTQKVLTSQAMVHHMRMFDTVLDRLKALFLVLESHRNIPVMLGNIWSTSVDLIVD